MAVNLSKNALDLGILAEDGPAALAFYRDLLGFAHACDEPVPGVGVMHRLLCGESHINIVVPTGAALKSRPEAVVGAAANLYLTIPVSNICELVAECAKAGRTVVVPEHEVRSGIRMAIVADPDGNWVEFLQTS
jgi:predicted enzyme related to lactoylglutathione lyase